ncbi:hypothetical protein [Phaffia rhodozyma]|uniref:Uncharacterized protein n=1 Tax=Phaffia rhodozyma TaxID=264483 RepID=A0A0F7SRI3_PHARH|nr:hypothetical protein [Phaffia rhodozyma]
MSEDTSSAVGHVGECDRLEEPTFEGCLRSLVPADKAILMNELPQLLEKLSSEKDVQIMTSDQMNIIRMYAEAEPDLEIDLEGLLNMFAQMNPGSMENASPTSDASVLGTPDLSLDLTDCSDLTNTKFTLPATPSTSSNPSTDPPSKCYKLNQISNLNSDGSDTQDLSVNLQDSSRKFQKAPPNSWERFSRPTPLGHGRRRSGGSIGLASAASDAGSEGEGARNEAQIASTPTMKDRRARRRSRQVSQPTDLPASGGSISTPPRRVSHDGSFLSSPGLNENSFISAANLVSPDSVSIPRNEREGSLEWDGEVKSRGSLKDEDSLCKQSTDSPQELAEMQDRIQEFEKTIADLTRKLRIAQEELEQTATDSENLTAEFQNRLEEMKAQLNSKRKEEKELRGKERGYLEQIQTFEADVSKLHQMVEMSKSTYSTLMKSYNEQIAECESLRNSIRTQDVEFKATQEVLDALESDTQRLEKEQTYLKQANELLLLDLSAARQAENCLEEQRMENLSLKETINRLRADLDNLRTMSAASLVSIQRVQAHNGPETLGRSLEKELLKQLQDPSLEVDLADPMRCDGATENELDNGDGESLVQALFAASREQYQREAFDEDVETEDQPAVIDQEDFTVAPEEEGSQMQVPIRTDEPMMAGLPAYSPRTAESLPTGISTQTSLIATAMDDSVSSLSTVDKSGWLTGIRQRQKKIRTVRLKPSFFTDSEAHPSSSLSFEAHFWDFTKRHGRSIITGAFLTGVTFYLGVVYADNQHPIGTNLQSVLSGDASVWQYYNDLARAQGAGVGFSQVPWEQPSWLGYLGAIGIGAVDHVTRRVPT